MASRLHKRIRIVWGSLALTAIAVMLWNMQAHGVLPNLLESRAGVSVFETDETIWFEPTDDTASAALLFFPGALIQPKAYVPLVRSIADSGFTAIIVKLPFRLAPTSGSVQEVERRALAIIQEDESGRSWVVGGHSRGGALAALFARDHPDALAGLLLVGSSHPKDYSLTSLDADVTKVVATNDGLASVEEVEQFAPNLPATTEFARIEGANHRQFGYYGWQLGDSGATISRDEQLGQTRAIVLRQLRRVAAIRDLMVNRN